MGEVKLEDNHAKIIEACPTTKQEIERHINCFLQEKAPKVYAQVKSRIKGVESTKNKIDKKRSDGHAEYGLGNVTDIIGVRVICHFVKDVPEVVSALLFAAKNKDFISKHYESVRIYTTTSPAQTALIKELDKVAREHELEFVKEEKPSRYTSVHMVWTLAERFLPRNVEIQVRTVFEDAWSEIEHALKYKGGGSAAIVSDDMQILNTLVQGCLEFSDLIYSRSRPTKREPINIEATSSETAHGKIVEEVRQLKELAAKGNLAEALDRFDKAISTYITAQDQEGIYELKVWRGEVLLEYGNPINAINYYEELYGQYPDDIYIGFRLGESYKQCGDFDASAKMLSVIFEKTFPEDGQFSFPADDRKRVVYERVPMKLSYCLWRQGDIDGAAKLLQRSRSMLGKHMSESLSLDFLNSEIYFELERLDADAVLSREQKNLKYRDLFKRMKSFGVTPDKKFGCNTMDTYITLASRCGEVLEARRGADLLRAMIKVHSPQDIRGLDDSGRWKALSPGDYILVASHIDAAQEFHA